MSDFDTPTGIAWQGEVGMVQYGQGDKGQVVLFYTKSVPHQAKSAEAGRLICEDKVYVRIHPPGERLNINDRPASDADKRRFPMQWMQFQENRQQIPDGTPIDLLYPDKPSIAQMLRASAVHTIEQCAELSAHAMDTVGMGAQGYVTAAKHYLEISNKGVGAAKLRRELEDRDRKINTLTGQVEHLQGEVQRLIQSNAAAMDMVTGAQTRVQGQMMRPAMPGSSPYVPPNFDAATAQINANSPTKLAASKQPAPKRSRVRIAT